MAGSILSISYDRALLLTRQALFEAAGYRVASAYGFTDAMRLCDNGSFDLMVMGHSIPPADKRVLIEQFRQHCDAPVVSLLRHGEPLVDGADYHASPDDPHELVSTVAEILQNGQRAA